MSNLETRLAQLERVRLMSKRRETDRRVKEFDKKIEELERELSAENERLKSITLTTQLSDFSKLSQSYAKILELVSMEEDADLIRSVQGSLDERKGQSTKVMKLFTNLMRNKN